MIHMKKKVCCLFGFFFLFFSVGLQAAEGWNSFIVNFNKKLYGNGTQTWQIVPYGNRWVYFANNGLVQFDGNEWQVFPLNNRQGVRSVHLSSGGGKRIYVGGINEFGYFEPDEAGELAYHCLSDTLDVSMRYLGNVWGIHELDNILYFQGDDRIVKLSEGKYTLIESRVKMDCSYVADGVLYIGTEHGIRFLVGNEFFPLTGAESIADARIRGIQPYRGGLLIATAYEGLFYYKNHTLTPFVTGAEDFMRRHEVFCMALQDDRIALGTIHRGILLVDGNTRACTYFNVNNGLRDNTVLSVAFDAQGNLWAGQDSGLGYVCLASPFTNLYSYPHSYGTGYAAALKDDKLYLGTNRSLYYTPYPVQLDGNLPDIRPVANSSGQVWNLCRIGDELLCLHDRGIFRVDGDKLTRFTDIIGAWTCQLVLGHDDLMYVGAYDGIYLLKRVGEEWRKVQKVAGLGGSFRLFEQETDRILWLHGSDHVLRAELDERLATVISQKEYAEEEGLPSNQVLGVAQIRGRICFLTPAGVYKYNRQTDSMEPWDEINKSLHGAIPYVCLLEREGRLIGLTPNEICMVDEAASGDSAHQQVELLHSSLLELVPGYESIVPLSDSLMILPTEGGFSLFRLPVAGRAPGYDRLHISRMYLSYPKDSLVYVANFGGKKPVPRIEYAFNSVRFEYSLPFLWEGNPVRFQYRLNSDEWSAPGTMRTKEFSNLHEGEYTFEIRALFPDGTSATDSIAFQILPPWYRAWPAYICYVFLLVALAWAIGRWDSMRVARKKRQAVVEKDREIQEMEQEYTAEKSRQEKLIMQLEKEKLEHDLQHKSQEMANLMINFVRKNEMLSEIKSEIMKVAAMLKGEGMRETKQQLVLLNGKIDANIQSDEVLKRIEEQFDLLHNNFMKRLHARHPDLSNNERMMCAYLKMNLSTKEIAPLLNISVRGVETMRYRLRKKLGLEREDSLTDYLCNRL